MSLAAHMLFQAVASMRSAYAASSESSSSTTFSLSSEATEQQQQQNLENSAAATPGSLLRGAANMLGSVLHVSSNARILQDPAVDPTLQTDDVLSVEEQVALDHFIDSQVAHAVSTVAAVIAIIISLHLIYRHLQYYARPLLQRQIIRIVVIVPVYALCSALSLGFDHYAPYINALRDVYEALCIHCFLVLMLDFPGGEDAVIEGIKDKGKMKHPKPFCCCPQMRLGVDFIVNMKRTTLQFVFLKPLMAFISIIAMAAGFFDTPELQSLFLFVYNISYTTALYGLFLYYKATKTLMKGFSPIGKFGAVKIIVFATYYQSLAVVAIPGMDSLGSSEKWNDFIICFEMAFFAVMHEYCFSHKEFMPGGVGVRDLKAMGFGEEPVNIKSDTSFKAAMSRIKDVFNLTDVWEDMKRNFSAGASQYILQGVEGGIMNEGTVELETQRAEQNKSGAIANFFRGKRAQLKEETNDEEDGKKDGASSSGAGGSSSNGADGTDLNNNLQAFGIEDDADSRHGFGTGISAAGGGDDFQSQLASMQLSSASENEKEKQAKLRREEEERKRKEDEKAKKEQDIARNGAVSARDAAASTAALMAASTAAAAELLAKLKADQATASGGGGAKGRRKAGAGGGASVSSTTTTASSAATAKDDSIRFVGDDDDEHDKNALDNLKNANPAFAAAVTTSALGNNAAGKATGKAVAALGGAAVAVATKVTAKVTDGIAMAGLGPRPKEGVAARMGTNGNGNDNVFSGGVAVDSAEVEKSVREGAAAAAAKKKAAASAEATATSTSPSTAPAAPVAAKLKIDSSRVKVTPAPAPARTEVATAVAASGASSSSWDFPEEAAATTSTPAKSAGTQKAATASSTTKTSAGTSSWADEVASTTTTTTAPAWNPDADFGFDASTTNAPVGTTTESSSSGAGWGEEAFTAIEETATSTSTTTASVDTSRARAPSGDAEFEQQPHEASVETRAARAPSGNDEGAQDEGEGETVKEVVIGNRVRVEGGNNDKQQQPEQLLEDDGRDSPVRNGEEMGAEAVGADEAEQQQEAAPADFESFAVVEEEGEHEPVAAETSAAEGGADEWGVLFDSAVVFDGSSSAASEKKAGETTADPFGGAVDDTWR